MSLEVERGGSIVLNRPVITGMGILAPNGVGLEAYWQSILSCESGIRPISNFDASEHRFPVAGEVQDFCLCQYTNGQFKPKRLGRHTQFALAATRMALDHAGVGPDLLGEISTMPVAIGVSTSAMDVIERNEDVLVAQGPRKVSPYGVSSCLPHAVTSSIAELIGIQTQRFTFSSACSAGLDALAFSANYIEEGRADMVITGGVDAAITPLTIASFSLSGLLPQSVREPGRMSRPFDLHRQGGILSEGAGVFVMESLGHALARGASPLGMVRGYGNNADAARSQAGMGLSDSMAQALANSSLVPSDIDYICAHGPSDPLIDRIETAMIKKVFSRRAYHFPVSSIKGVTGNPLSAAGPLQVAACLLAMRDGRVPPTANYEVPDPWCDLDYVPNEPRSMDLHRALVNLHGLGGGNSSLIIEQVRSA